MKLSAGYRVLQSKEGYSIAEVIYDEAGRIISCSSESIAPIGQTFDQLSYNITALQQALQQPVLHLDDIDTDAFVTWKQALEALNREPPTVTQEQLKAMFGLSDSPTTAKNDG